MKKVLLLLVFLFLIGASYAVPANPEPFYVEQPDGTNIEVRQIGDEKVAFVETLDGYTIIQDNESGYWTYAEVEDNELVPTSRIVGEASPPTQKHLQPELISGAVVSVPAKEFSAKYSYLLVFSLALFLVLFFMARKKHLNLSFLHLGFLVLFLFAILFICVENPTITGYAVFPKELVTKSSAATPPMQPFSAPVTNSDVGDLLVISVEFNGTGATHAISHYNDLVFNESNSGSMWYYYNETSYGQFNLTGFVVNEQNNDSWYNSSHTEISYGANGGGCAIYGYGSSYWGTTDHKNYCIFMLTRETLELADSQIDFSAYDSDSDGILEEGELSIMIVHAGSDEASSGSGNDIWSHKWIIYGSGWNVSNNDTGYNTSDLVLDGVRLSYSKDDYTSGKSDIVGYTMLSEGSPVGTFAHEFGHTLGLPDLYDVNGGTGGSSDGVGDWDIMASGTWNNGGDTPAHLSAWSKYYLGWVEPTVVSSGFTNASLSQIEKNQDLYMLLDSGYTTGNIPDSDGSEYFLVENRQKIGFDAYIPGDGLLIWHIDDSVGSIASNNIQNTASHKRVDLEEADGNEELDTQGSPKGQAGDTWENTTTGFNSTSLPNSSLYDGSASNVTVKEISESATTIYAILGFEGSSSDLQPINISVPSPLHYGHSDNIDLTVRNLETTNATNVLIYLYVNGTYDSNKTISNVPGNSIEITSMRPNLTYGTYNITFVVDPSNSLIETNETNNNLSAAVTVNHTAPTVVVTYPNTNITVSDSITITANVADADSDAEIAWFYYSNTSSNWTLIGNSTTLVGAEYNITWNTSTVSDGSNYKIKVNATDNTSLIGYDLSDSTFSINNVNDAPTIALTDPTGGEDWSDTETITWSTSDPEGDNLTIGIYYSNDSASTWYNISTNETNDGSYSWDTEDVSDGNDYRINVTATDPYDLMASDASSSDFEIDNSDSSTGEDEEDSADSGEELSLGGELTGWKSRLFSEIEAGKTINWSTPSSAGLDLTLVELTSKSNATDVRIKAKKLDEKPSSISTTPAGKVRQYFQMSLENLQTADISLITMKFKIPTSWFSANNLDESSFALRRWSGSGWSKISTDKYDSDSNYNYYKANTQQFSYFALTALEKETAAPPKTKKDSNKNSPLTEEATGAAGTETGTFKTIMDIKTFGLKNSYWLGIFVAIVIMFVFLVSGVNRQRRQGRRPRRPMMPSRWRAHTQYIKDRLTPPYWDYGGQY